MKPVAYHLRPLARSLVRPSTVLAFLAPLGLVGYLWYRRGPALDDVDVGTVTAGAILAFVSWICLAPPARLFPGRVTAWIPPIARMTVLAIALFILLVIATWLEDDGSIVRFLWLVGAIALVPLFLARTSCPSCKRVFALRRIVARDEAILAYKTDDTGQVQALPVRAHRTFRGCAYCGAACEDRWFDQITPALPRLLLDFFPAKIAAKNAEIAAAEDPAEKARKEQERKGLIVLAVLVGALLLVVLIAYRAYRYGKARVTGLMPGH